MYIATSTFKFKKYVNDEGFYAMVDLEVTVEQEAILRVQYDNDFVDEEWHKSVAFAMQYVYEHYQKAGKKGFSARVKRLHTMTGDTTHIVVFYVIVRGLIEALGNVFNSELVIFDEKEGTFSISK
jgi:hypothetical protein